jgi:hypothetical protein
MQHSVVARLGAWHARYVRPSAGARERRLGLRPASAFSAAPGRRTVLHRGDAGPLAALRATDRSLTVAPTAPATGRLTPRATIRWTSSQRDGRPRLASVAPAWPA